ncbi:MAG: protein kinase [Elusimicrobia bacterium]|nr:protein kinase [Elusimicrobiota bacterium]
MSRLLIRGSLAVLWACGAAAWAGGDCEEASYDAAYEACNASPPRPDCGQRRQTVESACQSEVQQAIGTLNGATSDDARKKAVENLRDIQRKIYYRMAELKSYWLFGSTGKSLSPSFDNFAKDSWYKMDDHIAKAGYPRTPNGDAQDEPAGAGPEGPEGGPAGRKKGDGPPPSKEAAEQLLSGGDPAGAEKMLDKLLESDPKNPDLLSMRSVARLNQGKPDGALKDAQAALALDPENKLARDMSDFITLSGQAKDTGVQLKKPDFGERNLSSGFDGGGGAGKAGRGGGRLGAPAGRGSPPGSAGGVDAVPAGGWVAGGREVGAGAYAPAAQMTLPMSQGLTGSQVLVQSAAKKLRLGDASGAFLEATRAIQADRRNAQAWTVRAGVSNRLKNHDAAIADATEALKVDPKNVPALLERGFAQYSLSNYSSALADIGSALALDPMNALGYLYRGMIFEKMARYKEALADYETAARLDPSLRHFWEEAKKRLQGQGGKGGGPGLASAKRAALWGGPAAALVLVLAGVWRKRSRQAAGTPPGSEQAEPAPALEPERLLDGTYRVERELGRGGMGVVYAGTDIKLQRPVALKRLRGEAYGSPELRERFLKEARLVAKLRHPHIAEIFAVVGTDDLTMVFELVEGRTLSAVLSERRRLPIDEAKRVVGEVCAALEYAHRERVIHRDIKPSNVMLDKAGQVKVMDFGVAHEVRGSSDSTLTAAWGTPPYMPPEQARGLVGKESDLYAVAVMAYEMLTGALPFQGLDLLEKKVKKDFPPATALNAQLPRSVDDFFSLALEPDPAKRFPPTAAEFDRAFRGLA